MCCHYLFACLACGNVFKATLPCGCCENSIRNKKERKPIILSYWSKKRNWPEQNRTNRNEKKNYQNKKVKRKKTTNLKQLWNFSFRIKMFWIRIKLTISYLKRNNFEIYSFIFEFCTIYSFISEKIYFATQIYWVSLSF